jgi:hypothetical protein
MQAVPFMLLKDSWSCATPANRSGLLSVDTQLLANLMLVLTGLLEVVSQALTVSSVPPKHSSALSSRSLAEEHPGGRGEGRVRVTVAALRVCISDGSMYLHPVNRTAQPRMVVDSSAQLRILKHTQPQR